MAEGESLGKRVRLIALIRIASNVEEAVSMTNSYYNPLALKVLSGAMTSTLVTVREISQFYNLDPSGEQHEK